MTISLKKILLSLIGLYFLCVFFIPYVTIASTISRPIYILNLQSGLLGWWTFDGKDMPNGVVNDISGNGNTGNFVNMATSTAYVTGKIGQALNFNGGNQYVATGQTSDTNFTNTTFTVSFWFKVSGTASVLVSKEGGSAGWYADVDLNSPGLHKLSFVLKSAAGVDILKNSSPNNVADNTWHMATIVVTTSTTVAANNVTTNYIDGVYSQDAPSVASGTYGTAVFPINIGVRGSAQNGYSNFTKGAVDDVRIYNRALSATEIAQLYKISSPSYQSVTLGGPANLKSGLLGWWTFDGKDMPNGVVNDISGNGNTGNFVHMATSSVYASGKIGQALDFADANGTCVSLPSLSASNWTISAWFKADSFSQGVNYNRIFGQAGFNLEIGVRGDTQKLVVYSGSWSAGGQTITVGNWYHVTVVSSGTSGTVYINGVSDSSPTTRALAGASVIGNQISCTAGNIQGWNGLIDDVRVYNRALSAPEVIQLYRMGVGSKTNVTLNGPSNLFNGLSGWWTFDGKDMPNGAVLDKSGNGNTGNFVNMSTSTNYVAGKFGQALSFNGSSNYIQTGANILKTSDNFTISAWIKASDTTAQQIIVWEGNSTENGWGNGAGTTNGEVHLGISQLDLGTGTLLPNYVSFYFGDSSIDAGVINISTPFSDKNSWHLITGTVANVSTAPSAVFYVDGVQVGTDTGTTLRTPRATWDINVRIGVPGTLIRYYNGAVDDVRIFNRVLSASEVAQLYSMGR